MDGECCGIKKRVRFKGLSSVNGNSGGRTSRDVRSVELLVNGVDGGCSAGSVHRRSDEAWNTGCKREPGGSCKRNVQDETISVIT